MLQIRCLKSQLNRNLRTNPTSWNTLLRCSSASSSTSQSLHNINHNQRRLYAESRNDNSDSSSSIAKRRIETAILETRLSGVAAFVAPELCVNSIRRLINYPEVSELTKLSNEAYALQRTDTKIGSKLRCIMRANHFPPQPQGNTWHIELEPLFTINFLGVRVWVGELT